MLKDYFDVRLSLARLLMIQLVLLRNGIRGNLPMARSFAKVAKNIEVIAKTAADRFVCRTTVAISEYGLNRKDSRQSKRLATSSIHDESHYYEPETENVEGNLRFTPIS